MMNNNVPQIRFKGYTHAWKQRKLGEVAKTITGGGTPSTTNGEFWNGDIPWIQSSDFTEHNVLDIRVKKHITIKGIQKSATKLITKNSIAIVTRVGVGKLAIIPFDYATSQDTLSLSELSINTLFCAYSVYSRLQKELNQVQGTSIKGITKEELLNKTISIPAEEVEQTQIGNFFRTLDDTIALYQRKLEGLRTLKKAYLQQMFPQAGERVPRVRVEGFSGEWESRRIGELFTERSERSGEGELISVTMNSGVVKASSLERKDNSSEDKSNYKRVESGDIAYNSMRMWQGASGVSDFSGILSPAYTVIIPNESVCSVFFSYMFKLTKMIQTFQSSSQGLTSDTWNLKFPLLKTIAVFVPCYEEQTVIGDFFRNLDSQIAAQSQKVEQLQALKKAYLQKMFV